MPPLLCLGLLADLGPLAVVGCLLVNLVERERLDAGRFFKGAFACERGNCSSTGPDARAPAPAAVDAAPCPPV